LRAPFCGPNFAGLFSVFRFFFQAAGWWGLRSQKARVFHIDGRDAIGGRGKADGGLAPVGGRVKCFRLLGVGGPPPHSNFPPWPPDLAALSYFRLRRGLPGRCCLPSEKGGAGLGADFAGRPWDAVNEGHSFPAPIGPGRDRWRPSVQRTGSSR